MADELIIYGYPSGCPACDQAKDVLEVLGLPYEFRPVERHSALRKRLLDLGADTLPSIYTASGAPLGGASELRKAARLGVTSLVAMNDGGLS